MPADVARRLEQLSLPFSALPVPERRPTIRRDDRLYFAVLPDPAAARRIAALADTVRAYYGLFGVPRPIGTLHVTLYGLGAFSEPAASLAREIAAEIAFEAFAVTFDRFASFGGKDRERRGTEANPRQHPLVLRCSDGAEHLTALRDGIGRAIRRFGLPAVTRAGFAPHVTMLYDPGRLPETTLRRPVTWVVRDFVLVRSFVGQARHAHLGRWPARP